MMLEGFGPRECLRRALAEALADEAMRGWTAPSPSFDKPR